MAKIPKATIAKGKDGQYFLKNFYSSLPDTKIEIQNRWRNEKLKKKINKLINSNSVFRHFSKPRAVLARPIASPNFEFFHFTKLSKGAELKPLYIECTNEKFVAGNLVKYHLCRPFFYDGKGKNGGNRVSAVSLVDFNKNGGRELSKIKTLEGKSLVKYHHNNLYLSFPRLRKEVFNISDWFKKLRFNSRKDYYFYYLSLFICHGVLFENYMINDPEERKFTENIVIPSFNKILNKYKIKPLIVPPLPLEKENDLLWYCYPEYIKNQD